MKTAVILFAIVIIGLLVAAITNRAKDKIAQAKRAHSSNNVHILSFSIEKEFKKTGTS